MIRTAASLGFAVVLSVAIFGQSTQKTPAFDIADFHPAIPLSNNSMKGPFLSGGRFEIRSANMLDLIRTAYGVDANNVVGGPNWLEMNRFDMVAKVPNGAKPDAMRIMLRTLLADRFKLVVHDDIRATPAYLLTAGKKPLVKPAEGSGEAGCKQQRSAPDAGPLQTFSCRNITMEQFAEAIRTLPNTIPSAFRAVDQTGLKGVWDFDIHYHVGPILPRIAATIGERITFMDAVQKQLGLDLNLGKAPQSVIVVDSANETPTANAANIAQMLPTLSTEFEVATIKPIMPGARGASSQILPGGSVTAQGTLRQLIIRAWNIYPNRPEELVSGPAFLDSDRYEIIAKAPAPLPVLDPASGAALPASATLYNETVNAMIRTLLIDRFKMVVHFENRPIEAFTLTAVKAKLQKADPSNRTAFRLTSTPAGRIWTCQNLTMAQFAASLQQMAGGYIHNGDVLDATKLEGAWDFTFTFSTFNGAPGSGARGAVPESADSVAAAATPDSGMTLFEALEKQLGLKLETTKRPGPVLVIDQIERKPTGN